MNLHYNGSEDGLTKSDVSTLIDELQAWRDPTNGQYVDKMGLVVDGADNPILVSIQLRVTDVGVDSIQTARDALASDVDGFTTDFGTLTDLKATIRVQ